MPSSDSRWGEVLQFLQHRWKAVLLLAGAQLTGNLASLSMLTERGTETGTPLLWLLYTLLSIPLIALGLFASRDSTAGAPLLPGGERRTSRARAASRMLLFAVFTASAGALPMLLMHGGQAQQLDVHPLAWFGASLDAGIQEEITYRLLLLSLLLLGLRGVTRRRPLAPSTLAMMAIIASATLFGYAHIDADSTASRLGLSAAGRADTFVVSAALGCWWGWLFWRHGIETAILSHVAFDATGPLLMHFIWTDAEPLPRVAPILSLATVAAAALILLRRSGNAGVDGTQDRGVPGSSRTGKN